MPEYRDDEYEYDEPEEFDAPEDEVDDLDLDDDFSGADLAKREATRKPYRFRGATGTVYEIPHPDLWPTRSELSLTQGDLAGWAMDVFGGDTDLAQSFLDEPRYVMRPAMERVVEIVNETSKAGLNRGERRASARTSRSTRTRSKRR
ncbi:hypothetical protein [Streptomyces aurantiogriseus]|uniref:Tail assembly chaperone n=1 Tax=Streptomyces aurantiogriseus TaxID=66870 RepID=A0A918CJE3_9ACTN|nr:hypothetical protein [Streptomyces aurantiogriseus]GGR24192.1 hypothetical protein GCM10010251_45330 [Streptomyces aurantiogriseus]